MNRLQFGYSPCPNDTFMFNAIAAGDIGIEGHLIEPQLHDVETLNAKAMEAVFDISKLSCYAWMAVKERYQLLSAGAAMGFGCGPVLIARQPVAPEAIREKRVILPGKWTTAHLLFRLWAPDADQRMFVPYNRIFDMLESGEADCGVIIHESRFTFEQAGFTAIVDLGAWWEEQSGLPIPLGCIAARKALGTALIERIDALIKSSIQRGMDKQEKALPYIRAHAQEMDERVLKAHIHTFVNPFSLDLGEKGQKALDVLETMARDSGVL
ncbi:MAG: 1,4-dihydroxy-6-naphthoate synthase [Proteobacteria bacterium]|nr:MAG: 1,4-dihydroxy-6-naphthoate synthase [Pseudomonadota bacterium]PIE67312.1 MAG: 1,4-dihydroxy-6-naphthoate synthase [Deltaproteobacteria bacterium]